MTSHDNNYKIFNVGIYLRLSREDDLSGVSESIQNQRDFLTRYVIQNGWNVAGVYADDGYSGTNFERPEFKRLIYDIESGKIDCVVTKDLSRLGRDYIMTGHYLEKYFPENQVRYIAVNDGIDTFEDNSNNDMSPFRSVINDMYAKDISKKVRTALHTQKLNGNFIGSVPPYGYIKDPDNKHKLIIDTKTAEVVKRIYEMFIEGKTKLGIANQLSAEGVLTPSQSKNLKATQKRHKGIWNEVIINRILTNPTYIGNLTQNRAKKINYKVNAKVNLSSDKWIIVENTHEPIISVDDFNLVQQIMSKKGYVKKDNKPAHLLTGIVKCGDCNGAMTFSKESPTRTYIVCSTWRKHAKLGLCTSHCIRESYVEEQVITALRESAINLDRNRIIDNTSESTNQNLSLENDIKEFNVQLEQIKSVIANLYMDKVKGVISENDFMDMSANFGLEREKISKQIQRIQDTVNHRRKLESNNDTILTMLERFLTFEDIDRTTLSILVDKVEIFNNKQIKIHFNFHI